MRRISSINIKPLLSLLIVLVLYILGVYLEVQHFQNTAWLQQSLGIIFGAAISAILAWDNWIRAQKMEAIGITDYLPDRADEDWYRDRLEKAKQKVWVLGVTASRMMDDFADLSASRPEKQVLLAAMDKGVDVRILVPHPEFLEENRDIRRAETAEEIFQSLQQRHPDRFNYRYFKSAPAHNLFLIDNLCIIGPVLHGRPSRNTPALVLDASSSFASTYVQYFESVWKRLE